MGKCCKANRIKDLIKDSFVNDKHWIHFLNYKNSLVSKKDGERLIVTAKQGNGLFLNEKKKSL
jgi:hypothetical protein